MQPGQRLGKYVLGERIAIGGMAEVWAARVEGPQGFVKPLALKFMLESFAGDPELERLFVNEARVAAQLQHANIVSIFDFDKLGPQLGPGLAGRYYIAMERVEGRDLRQIEQAIARAGRTFPRPLALHVAGEVLKGLRYVHEKRGEGRRPLGLIHRDVSPHNVLVSYAGEVKLSDFGIAKARALSTSGKGTGNIRGKLSYASPEQLDDAPLDHRTDQFAFGVTLWELLAGRKLFDGRDELEVMTQVSRCAIPPLASLPGTRDIDPAIDAVVRRMLARRVDDRFATTGEALSAVLTLPGYTADSAPLGNLLRTLFGTQTDFPATGPVGALPPAPPVEPPLADTMTMQAVPRSPGPAAGTPTRTSGAHAVVPRAPRRSGTPTPSRPGRSSWPAAGGDAQEGGRARGGRPRAAVIALGVGLLVVVVAGVTLWRSLAAPTRGVETRPGRELIAPGSTAAESPASRAPAVATPVAAPEQPAVPGPLGPVRVVAPPANGAPPPLVAVPEKVPGPFPSALPSVVPQLAPTGPVGVEPLSSVAPPLPPASIAAPDAGKRPGAPNAAPIIE